MATTIQTWTEQGVALIASQAVTKGALVRATLNLQAKIAARLFVCFGRTGTTAFTGNPPSLVIRGSHNNFAFRAPANVYGRQGNSVTAAKPTFSSSPAAAATSFTVSSASGLSVGDLLCLSPGTSGHEEWARISNINSTTITVDAPLLFSHTSGQDITNQADAWEIVIPGGQYYEIIADYGGASAGDDIRVAAWYQTYDSDTTS